MLQCRDGYMLKGNNTTQCYFGNWTGMTPWCKEGEAPPVYCVVLYSTVLYCTVVYCTVLY